MIHSEQKQRMTSSLGGKGTDPGQIGRAFVDSLVEGLGTRLSRSESMEVGPLPGLSGNADLRQRKRAHVHAFLLGGVSWVALPDDRELDDGKRE